MSTDRAKGFIRGLEILLMIFAVGAGVISLVGFLVLLPHRLEAVEGEVREIKAGDKADHELLLRMDERLKVIQQTLEKRGDQ